MASPQFMITHSNALIEVLARLDANPRGHRLTVPLSCAKNVENLDEWAAKHGLQKKIVGKLLSLWRDE